MTKLLAAALAFLALGTLAACKSSTDANFIFQFQSTRLDEEPEAPTPTEAASPGPGVVVIVGDELTPCSFDRIVAEGRRRGNTLRLTVQRVVEQPCTSTERHHEWIAAFSALNPGVYRVEVTSEVAGGTAVVELEEDVTVL